MREIKFRAWDEFRNKMVDSRLILKINFTRIDHTPNLLTYMKKYKSQAIELYDEDKMFANEFILMQDTGIKDKNGVEIYEGDILLNESNLCQSDGNLITKVIGDIQILNGMTYLIGKTWQSLDGEDVRISEYRALFLSPTIFEVIGNIYENKDLRDGGC